MEQCKSSLLTQVPNDNLLLQRICQPYTCPQRSASCQPAIPSSPSSFPRRRLRCVGPRNPNPDLASVAPRGGCLLPAANRTPLQRRQLLMEFPAPNPALTSSAMASLSTLTPPSEDIMETVIGSFHCCCYFLFADFSRQNGKMRPLSFSSTSIFLLLFSTAIEVAGALDPQLCSPSLCGGLQIRYPFRLKGDPANCGDRNFEVTCRGNRTFMEIQPSEYFVSGIYYEDTTIQLVDVSLLQSNCSIPVKYLSPSSAQRLTSCKLLYWNWISFTNCSKKISSKDYQFVPCLSREGEYVYAVSGFYVSDLAPSCSVLSMIPAKQVSDAKADLFPVLQKGFQLSWSSNRLTASKLIKRCLRDSKSMFDDNFKRNNIFSLIPAIFKGEMHFPACIEDYTSLERNFKLIFRISVAVIVFIEIAQLAIALALIGRLVFAPLVIFVFLVHKFWSNWASTDAVEKFLKTQQIKLLGENFKCNGDEFISEVSTIGRIHHLNVVRLVGFCSEGSKRALVYEFMPNGSLDKYIFSSDGTPIRSFPWEKLNNIALGVARGIDYLHRGCDMTILHFDIKPQNILLDRSFTPKVADFGLAKLYPKEFNVVSVSAARGTIGYIAPELVSRNFGVISHKSDVYSFGMLLMEMAAGRRNVDPNAGSSSQVYYPALIYDKLHRRQKEINEFGDSFEMNEVEKKLYMIGLWCIQMRPLDRPSMNQVLQMLESDATSLQMPPKPFIALSSTISRNVSFENTTSTDLTGICEDECSSYDSR
ncbi:putative receptor-like protein kinase [Apostasia shenzhenica]|uniref:Putative receptor-like protein kinase n=1 Tax=Apostasia shenzhenica TaxID=1088818 RepID=A0A2I0B1S2_9ASPA|nr:putative receptor-like protein kinase [Apostasia shenzhenica]